jgi:putative membrane protein
MRKIVCALLIAVVAVPAAAAPMSPGEYVMTAGASDLYERMSAQTVLQTTQDPRVRDFAQMMLSAHSQSTAKVKAQADAAQAHAASNRDDCATPRRDRSRA